MKDFVVSSGISIDSSLCIRHTFSRSHCRDCKIVCPADAIRFSPFPEIIKDSCIECSLCYSACKFSAINTYKNDDFVLKETQELQEIDIGCVFSDSKIKVSCISRITEDLLFSWIKDNKNIFIKKGSCNNCKFKESLFLFYEHLKSGVKLARAFGLKINIKINKSTTKKVYIPSDSFSRRDIFTFVKKKASKKRTKREILLDLVKNEKPKINIKFSKIGKISISDACTVCGVCEYVCPTSAILIKKGEKGRVMFNPQLCVNCKECKEACLYNAITIEDSYVSDLTSKPILLFEAQRKFCKVCNKPFYSSDKDKKLCSKCENKFGKEDEIINFIKNL